MRVLMILPALTEAKSPLFRPIKYSLFPPLGLATLAAYLDPGDDVRIVDQHVESGPPLEFDASDRPDLVVIQVYITNAYRAYALADAYRKQGILVALGGLHVTSLPEEAAAHADVVFLGPGESTFPEFLGDLRAGGRGGIRRVYDSRSHARTLDRVPPIRRDLIQRSKYLVPNSIVVSRGCPHHCHFCYKDAFYQGGRSFYTQRVDDALAEIHRLPGRHLYFLDDHLLGDVRFASALFDGLKGCGRVFQGAATIDSILRPGLVEKAVDAGLRSIFIGFESLSPAALAETNKRQNLDRAGGRRDYDLAIRKLDDLGVAINGSFVFGIDGDDPGVFDRTVDWASSRGITTATFHVATPYPGTELFRRIDGEGRLLHRRWDEYDTRRAVFEPRGMTIRQLDEGYARAYREFYALGRVWRASRQHASPESRLRHLLYALAWKRCEGLWNVLIKTGVIGAMRPVIEHGLEIRGRGRRPVEPAEQAEPEPLEGVELRIRGASWPPQQAAAARSSEARHAAEARESGAD